MNAPATVGSVLSEEVVRAALAQAQGRRPVEALSALLGLPKEEFITQAARYFSLEPLTMAELRSCVPDFTVISYVEATQRQCVALTDAAQRRLLVLADPLEARTRAWATHRLRRQGNRELVWALADSDDMRAFLTLAEKSMRAMDAVGLAPVAAGAHDSMALSVSIADISASDSPIVRLVDSTIHDALKSEASDIHLETQRNGLVIKYRIDGVLEVVKRVDGLEAAHQVLSRVKVIAELDIAERRIPQDGRFKVAVDSREIDLRVSIMPNLFGEDAVLRILDRQHLSGQTRQIKLENLGFEPGVLDFVRNLSALPYGLLLVTGPTGSGKTTTLYAALAEIHTGLDKIITIEDPVEYQVADVLQIPVNEKKGLTFARGLRSILRHDPDKIMVGEIRDPETAQIAVQAALTGHQVFTTVHANNVFDVIGRFVNMGVDTYSFVSALNGILAQRLVRLTCTQCAKRYSPETSELERSKITVPKGTKPSFMRGLGCANCRGTGYKGRKAIAETLELTDTLRDLLAERASLSRIKAAAHEVGFQSLREAAVAAAVAGVTTLEEINRVTPVA
ncbi:MAG: type secretion system protein [Burkholderiaceae bacterium]|jgi:general secretion pathway protein E|nr:type secretion system protein [Burkholderiaceae bacterium]